MALGGILGSGVKVAFSASSPVSWTTVGQIDDLDFPGLNPDEVETTVHGTSNFKRFMRGLIDVGELMVTVLKDGNQATSPVQKTIRNYQIAGTTIYWRVEIPTDRDRSAYEAFEFQGWVKTFSPKVPKADKQTLQFSVRFDDTAFTRYDAGSSAIS